MLLGGLWRACSALADNHGLDGWMADAFLLFAFLIQPLMLLDGLLMASSALADNHGLDEWWMGDDHSHNHQKDCSNRTPSPPPI